MSVLYYYRIFSIPENSYQYVWGSREPKTDLSGNAINQNATTVINTITISSATINIAYSDSPYNVPIGGGTINCDTLSDDIVVNMPNATIITGQIYYITNTSDKYNITILPYESQTLDNNGKFILIPGQVITIQSNGINLTSDIHIELYNNTNLTTSSMQIGEIYFEDLKAPYSTGDLKQNNPVELSPSFTLVTSSSLLFEISDNNRLRYTGTQTKLFNCTFTISCNTDTSDNTVWIIELRKNGVNTPGCSFRQYFSSSQDIRCISVCKIINISSGDTLSLYATNTSGAGGLSVTNLNIIAVGDYSV